MRLLQYGLVEESELLEKMQSGGGKKRRPGVENNSQKATRDVSETEDDANPEDLIERQTKFTRRAIKRAKRRETGDATSLIRNPAAILARKDLISGFLLETAARKKCVRCSGITPTYRRDRNVKIFKMVLSKSQRDQMKQLGLKTANPLLLRLEEQKLHQPIEKPMTNGWHWDEQSSMDLEETSIDESHGAEEEIALHNVLETTAEAKTAELEDEDAIQQYMTATEVRAALELLFEREQEIMRLIFRPFSTRLTKVTPDMFFLTRILVPPNRFRPPSKQADGSVSEDQQNGTLNRVIFAANEVHQIARDMKKAAQDPSARTRGHLDHVTAGVALQEAVNALIDRSPNPNSGRVNEVGIKQKLEKKEGLFRQNMMGKRVNFAARSVISPDPNLETNEIGVPMVFARKLTYPEPVTSHNYDAMSKAVINGMEKYPGAAAIENEKGLMLSLRSKTIDQRRALAKQLLTPSVPGLKGAHGKIVHRHLQTGDIVIMNRQPTLHKPSMMAHRARVLQKETTIRMHYANCNTYNADFDGDEMNLHFPQNELARAESFEIADTDHQYLSGTAGKPLRGLIQDHLSMGVQFTSRDVFFDKDQYHQLLYSCLRPEDHNTVGDRIEMVQPAILKPRRLWTGKQIISTLLKNLTPSGYEGLNLASRSSTSSSSWGETVKEEPADFDVTSEKITFCDTEQLVLFQNGEHLLGILDKSQLGPSIGGLVHSIHELYGHVVAGKFLSTLSRLLTRFLHERAWSCGMDDLYLTRDGEKKRRRELNQSARLGQEISKAYVSFESEFIAKRDPILLERLENVLRNDDQQFGLDQTYNAKTKSITEKVTSACLPAALRKPFPKNQMQAMTISGAKGSTVNASLISCNLGQQVLEGRRVPTMVSGKTLPSFREFETDPMAGGYISGRFLTGIRPQEYFFHAMSGREGLIDTAVKTSKSGYLQRCVVKGLEGLMTAYDSSVRESSNGIIVQFLYGEDALDVAKQKHLTEFTFLAQNHVSVAAGMNIEELLPKITREELEDLDEKQKAILKSTRRELAEDPITADYAPARNLGSTSEAFALAVANYIKKNIDQTIKDKKRGIEGLVSKKYFQKLMNIKYLRSVVDPGDAVGVIAAQSVGEPSTQMTLNTFHLAGHSAKNVTLGIPRLREIIMTASQDIALPTMTVKLIPELSSDDGNRFAKSISRLSLAEVIEGLSVTERTGESIGYPGEKIFDIMIDLYSPREYQEEYAITIEDVKRTLEQRFVRRLETVLKAEINKKLKEASLSATTASVPEVGASVGRTEEARPGQGGPDAEGVNDDADDDYDTDDAKQTSTRDRLNETFDDPDEDEAVVAESSDDDLGDVDEGSANGMNKPVQRPPQNLREENPDDLDDDSPTSDKEEEFKSLQASNPHLKKFQFSRNQGRKAHVLFGYPEKTPKILLLPIVEEAARWSVIHSIPNIRNCALFEERVTDPKTGKPMMTINSVTGKKEEVKEHVVMCEGVNLVAIRDFQDIINPHTVSTNSVAHMLRYYGVEAARATIIKEIDNVFKVHGISVDNRHINLIADAMTQSGGYKAFSRHGLLKESGSVFGKMSFETVTKFLQEAVLNSETDLLLGPSARLVVGKRAGMGTGSFDVLVPVS